MKKYIRRIYMKTDHIYFNTFMHVGIVQTLLMGLLFTVFFHFETVRESQLFNLTTEYLPFQNSAILWGVALLLVVAGHVFEMMVRGTFIGSVVGITGFMLWAYAGVLWMQTGNYIVVAIGVVPALIYWAWYAVSSRKYREDLKNGIIPSVS